jgi:hypothetical protein
MPQTSITRSWVSRARAPTTVAVTRPQPAAAARPHVGKTALKNIPCGIPVMSVLWDGAGDPVSCLADDSIKATALSCTAATAASWTTTQQSCSFSPDVGTLKNALPKHHTIPGKTLHVVLYSMRRSEADLAGIAAVRLPSVSEKGGGPHQMLTGSN